jgi:membrane associated rhomboid family serine protease
MREAAVGVRCPECAGGPKGGGRITGRLARAGAGSSTPLASAVLVGLMAFVFLVQVSQGSSVGRGVDLSTIAGDLSVSTVTIEDGEWWRLVTSAFVHSGLIHLLFNAYLLWYLGGALESYAGRGRMLAIFFISVLWGSALALQFSDPGTHTVGASGGVFGLMAALFLLERTKGVSLMGSSVGGLLALNLLLTFIYPGISVGGHIGGLIGGAAAGFVLSGFGRGHLAYTKLGGAGGAALLALAAAAVVIAAAAI